MINDIAHDKTERASVLAKQAIPSSRVARTNSPTAHHISPRTVISSLPHACHMTTSSASTAAAYILYTPQGPRPLSQLVIHSKHAIHCTNHGIPGSLSGRNNHSHRSAALRPLSSSHSSAGAAPRRRTWRARESESAVGPVGAVSDRPAHVTDSGQNGWAGRQSILRCLPEVAAVYDRVSQSQLLYIPAYTSVSFLGSNATNKGNSTNYTNHHTNMSSGAAAAAAASREMSARAGISCSRVPPARSSVLVLQMRCESTRTHAAHMPPLLRDVELTSPADTRPPPSSSSSSDEKNMLKKNDCAPSTATADTLPWFTIVVTLMDGLGVARRVVLTPAARAVELHEHHAKVPLRCVAYSEWLCIYLDLTALYESLFLPRPTSHASQRCHSSGTRTAHPTYTCSDAFVQQKSGNQRRCSRSSSSSSVSDTIHSRDSNQNSSSSSGGGGGRVGEHDIDEHVAGVRNRVAESAALAKSRRGLRECRLREVEVVSGSCDIFLRRMLALADMPAWHTSPLHAIYHNTHRNTANTSMNMAKEKSSRRTCDDTSYSAEAVLFYVPHDGALVSKSLGGVVSRVNRTPMDAALRLPARVTHCRVVCVESGYEAALRRAAVPWTAAHRLPVKTTIQDEEKVVCAEREVTIHAQKPQQGARVSETRSAVSMPLAEAGDAMRRRVEDEAQLCAHVTHAHASSACYEAASYSAAVQNESRTQDGQDILHALASQQQQEQQQQQQTDMLVANAHKQEESLQPYESTPTYSAHAPAETYAVSSTGSSASDSTTLSSPPTACERTRRPHLTQSSSHVRPATYTDAADQDGDRKRLGCVDGMQTTKKTTSPTSLRTWEMDTGEAVRQRDMWRRSREAAADRPASNCRNYEPTDPSSSSCAHTHCDGLLRAPTHDHRRRSNNAPLCDLHVCERSYENGLEASRDDTTSALGGMRRHETMETTLPLRAAVGLLYERIRCIDVLLAHTGADEQAEVRTDHTHSQHDRVDARMPPMRQSCTALDEHVASAMNMNAKVKDVDDAEAVEDTEAEAISDAIANKAVKDVCSSPLFACEEAAVIAPQDPHARTHENVLTSAAATAALHRTEPIQSDEPRSHHHAHGEAAWVPRASTMHEAAALDDSKRTASAHEARTTHTDAAAALHAAFACKEDTLSVPAWQHALNKPLHDKVSCPEHPHSSLSATPLRPRAALTLEPAAFVTRTPHEHSNHSVAPLPHSHTRQPTQRGGASEYAHRMIQSIAMSSAVTERVDSVSASRRRACPTRMTRVSQGITTTDTAAVTAVSERATTTATAIIPSETCTSASAFDADVNAAEELTMMNASHNATYAQVADVQGAIVEVCTGRPIVGWTGPTLTPPLPPPPWSPATRWMSREPGIGAGRNNPTECPANDTNHVHRRDDAAHGGGAGAATTHTVTYSQPDVTRNNSSTAMRRHAGTKPDCADQKHIHSGASFSSSSASSSASSWTFHSEAANWTTTTTTMGAVTKGCPHTGETTDSVCLEEEAEDVMREEEATLTRHRVDKWESEGPIVCTSPPRRLLFPETAAAAPLPSTPPRWSHRKGGTVFVSPAQRQRSGATHELHDENSNTKDNNDAVNRPVLRRGAVDRYTAWASPMATPVQGGQDAWVESGQLERSLDHRSRHGPHSGHARSCVTKDRNTTYTPRAAGVMYALQQMCVGVAENALSAGVKQKLSIVGEEGGAMVTGRRVTRRQEESPSGRYRYDAMLDCYLDVYRNCYVACADAPEQPRE